MRFRRLVALPLVAVAALASAATPAAAATRAGCSVRVPVAVAGDGSFSGVARGGSTCAGSLAGVTLSARSGTAAITGRLRPGPTRCMPTLEDGRLTLSVPRLLSFGDGGDMVVRAGWALDVPAVAGAVTGAGTANEHGISLTGAIRYVAGAGTCSGGGFAPGAVELALGLTDGQAPADERQAPDADAGDDGAREPRKAKSNRRCSRKQREARRRGDGKRRCRRAARQR